MQAFANPLMAVAAPDDAPSELRRFGALKISERANFERYVTQRRRRLLMENIYVSSMYYWHVAGISGEKYRELTEFPLNAVRDRRLTRGEIESFYKDERYRHLMLEQKYVDIIQNSDLDSSEQRLTSLYVDELSEEDRAQRRVELVSRFQLRLFLYHMRRISNLRAIYFSMLFDKVKQYFERLPRSAEPDIRPYERLTMTLLLMVEEHDEVYAPFVSTLYYPSHEHLVDSRVFGDAYDVESPLLSWWKDLGMLMHANVHLRRMIVSGIDSENTIEWNVTSYVLGAPHNYYRRYRNLSDYDAYSSVSQGLGHALVYGSAVKELSFASAVQMHLCFWYVSLFVVAFNPYIEFRDTTRYALLFPRMTHLHLKDSQWEAVVQNDTRLSICMLSMLIANAPRLLFLNHSFWWIRHEVRNPLAGDVEFNRLPSIGVINENPFEPSGLRELILRQFCGNDARTKLYALPNAEIHFQDGRVELVEQMRQWSTPRAIKLRIMYNYTLAFNEGIDETGELDQSCADEPYGRFASPRIQSLRNVISGDEHSVAAKPGLQHFEALLGIFSVRVQQRDRVAEWSKMRRHSVAFNSAFGTRFETHSVSGVDLELPVEYIGLDVVIANPDVRYFKVQVAITDEYIVHNYKFLTRTYSRDTERALIRGAQALEELDDLWKPLSDDEALDRDRAVRYVYDRFGRHAANMMGALFDNNNIEVCLMDVIVVSEHLFFDPDLNFANPIGKQLPTTTLLNDAFEKVIRLRRTRAPSHHLASTSASSRIGIQSLAQLAHAASRSQEVVPHQLYPRRHQYAD